MRILAFLLLVGAAAAAYSGAFYTTGSQYYEGCWQRRAQEKIDTMKEAEAITPSQAVLWASCTPIVGETMDQAGYVMGHSGENASVDMKTLARSCPDRFTEVPLNIDRFYYRIIETIEKTGGPKLVDYVAPASWLIERALKARWPRCTEAARPYIEKAKSALSK